MTTAAPEQTPNTPAPINEDNLGIRGLLSMDTYRKSFEEVLGKRKAAQFISSIITVVGGSAQLQRCTPKSVIAAAAQAAALDLSIVPTIGQAAVVPYKNSKKDAQGNWTEVHEGQFQIMTRGVLALAHRTGKYHKLHFVEIYEGQIVRVDEIKGIYEFDQNKRISDRVVGFYFRFELNNGFVHEAYWSCRKCVAHGWKYSKSFRLYNNGQWPDDPMLPKAGEGKNAKVDLSKWDGFLTYGSGTYAMSAKTIVKNTINKWGPISVDMQEAFASDQAVIREDGTKAYVDTTEAEPADGKDPSEAPMPTEAPEGGAKPPAEASIGPAIKEATFAIKSRGNVKHKGKSYHTARAATDDRVYLFDSPELESVLDEAFKAKLAVTVKYDEDGDKRFGLEVTVVK